MSDSDSDRQSPFPDEAADDGSEDSNVSLIRFVRKKAFLYTKSDKRYSDRNLTERTWSCIASELGLTKDEARKKWTRIRNNFSKMLARRKAKVPPSDSAASAPHKPWLYESELEFLKRHVSHHSQPRTMSCSMNTPYTRLSPTPSTSTLQSQTVEAEPRAEDLQADEIEIEEEESLHGSEIVDMATTAKLKQTKFSKSPDHSSLDQAMITYVETMTNRNEDPLLMWFKGLIPCLKTLSPERLLSFQIRTMQEMHRMTYQDEHQPNVQYSSSRVQTKATKV